MDIQHATAAVRRFNRFYTNRLGLLDETLTHSAFTLTEARVLFEIDARTRPAASAPAGEAGFLRDAFGLESGPAASDITRELHLDAAYLTRILRKFGAAGLTVAQPDPADGRRRILGLTARGRAALRGLYAAADRDIGRLLGELPPSGQARLAAAMEEIEALLSGAAQDAGTVVLRPHRPGDVGWVISRQSALYAEEYGWDIGFEAMLAEIGGAFIRDFRAGRDHCWIADLRGERVGAVFLVHTDDPAVGKLRMLHVEASARDHGIGRLLVRTCIEAARAAGYRRLMLWTNDILHAARRIYENEGFVLVSEDRHHSFGKDLVGQTWELDL
jgi:DNA-binding MarR family transcriptional regulator/GNAT superfamily N-acetyltransferase